MTDRVPTIVVDDAIAHAHAAFGGLGDIVAVPGRAIDRTVVRDADVLVTRSVTVVDQALIEGTRLGMVATATAGIDHIDTDALARAGIAFASAAGCNAQAVAQYVLAALAEAHARRHARLPGPVGVVGFGHVGRRTTRLLRAYGLTVLACDPPLAARREDPAPIDRDPALDALARTEPLLSLHDLLDRCAVVSLHVPKTTTGPWPTAAMIDAPALAALRRGALVLSTCRGGVVHEPALLPWLAQGRGAAVLDVFSGEPHLTHPQLLHPDTGVLLVTPHIAGYTHEGKLAATQLAAQAVAHHLRRTLSWTMPPHPDGPRPLALGDGPGAVEALLRQAAGLTDDDARLRALAVLSPETRGHAFEALRRGYRMRSEHRNVPVLVSDAQMPGARQLADLGFAVASR